MVVVSTVWEDSLHNSHVEIKYIYLKVKKFSILKRFKISLFTRKGLLKLQLSGRGGGHEFNQTLQNWSLIGHYYCCLGPELWFFFFFHTWEYIERSQKTIFPPERNFGDNLGKGTYFSQGQEQVHISAKDRSSSNMVPALDDIPLLNCFCALYYNEGEGSLHCYLNHLNSTWGF